MDRTKCSGLGICEGLAPDVFEVGEDDKVMILVDDISDRSVIDVENAVASCPVEALRLLKN